MAKKVAKQTKKKAKAGKVKKAASKKTKAKVTKKKAATRKSTPLTRKKTAKKVVKKTAKKVVKKVAKAAASKTTSKSKKVSKKPKLVARPSRWSPPKAPECELPAKLPTEAQLRRVKTDLTRKDLQHYYDRLMEKRAVILGDVTTMENDARNNNSGGNLSNMPVHMADIGSDNYEQEFTLGLVESERKLLNEIDAALMRIKNKTYGVCIERAIPIGRERLDAKPWAKYCIEVARQKERQGQR